ncbi:hypothetical protein SAMN06309944_2148 [Micrococcales bacterium KH10]|nr:hypothetical protein SAMN06309944_2148 [Micrococcales bacterium KH10]
MPSTVYPPSESDATPPGTLSPQDAQIIAARGGYGAEDPAATITADDIAEVAHQLGRTPRGMVAISARCVCGRPWAVKTAPRLDDGTPFPTLFYLTHPALTAAASTLEAAGVMKEMTQRLSEDESLAAAYRSAHEAYLAEREALAHVSEIEGISAGGMPTRVKCLHVLIGHSLSAGPGQNPLGDEAIALAINARLFTPGQCQCVARPAEEAADG